MNKAYSPGSFLVLDNRGTWLSECARPSSDGVQYIEIMTDAEVWNYQNEASGPSDSSTRSPIPQ